MTPNAVWVGLGTWKFGYIPKGTAKEIAPLMDSGSMFEAEFRISQCKPVSRYCGPNNKTNTNAGSGSGKYIFLF